MALLRYIRRKALDIGLWLLLAVCVLVMLKASSDPAPTWARGTSIQALLAPFPTGNQIAFDTSVGVIVSLLVYVLVVRLPERKKRLRIKATLKRQYSILKDECIINLLFACEGSADLDLAERLKDLEECKSFFNQPVSADQNRWHAVLNGLDEQKVKAIIQELSVFRRELEYALISVDVEDSEVFAFLRRLAHVLQRSQSWTAEYEEIRPLSQFMWSILTGWDPVLGYTGKDVITEMIDAM